MSIFASPRFLPRVMAADALSCAATGALQLGLGDTLARLTGLPSPLLSGTGVFLLAYAALAAWMARRPVPPRRLIGLVIVGNLAWAAGCVALLLGGGFTPTALGVAWVLAQAAVVLVLAELQWLGLRASAHGNAARPTGLRHVPN
ncbi:hypothetical protein [Variovorax sp. UMC13]|uniref:hypothetical protein n=1 Tax=Variovorax sp. UMC13 TaxID=1862326 RepID=UPI0015FF794C|nr:hypothetical protein [Variovorax sp. UMC13]MBB1601190.1 hypothetical protein [Variovorax sp. UMC13]